METKKSISSYSTIQGNDVEYGVVINEKSKRFKYIIKIFPKTTEKNNELKSRVQV
jgi:hypothetical protein